MDIVPIPPKGVNRKKKDKYGLSKIIEDGSAFFVCPVGVCLETHQNRLMASCYSRGWKVTTRQLVEDGLAGVRVWKVEQ